MSERAAAAELEWSTPERIPGYADQTLTPHLFADREGRVHAVTEQWREEGLREQMILHRSWTPSDGWSRPVEVIPPPYTVHSEVEGMLVDDRGTLHVVFFGGDDASANVYYSRVRVEDADRPDAWSWPAPIGPEARTPRCVALYGDQRGNLVVVFGAGAEKRGLFVTVSNDAGDSWSEPEPIFLAEDEGLMPYAIELAGGVEERLHAVWNVVNVKGQNVAGYYARLDLERREWTKPIKIDDSIGTELGMGLAAPAVIEHGGEVLLLYNNGVPPRIAPPAIWFRRTSGGGDAWSEPLRPFPRHFGRNGRIAFVTDAAANLHVLFGQRIPGMQARDIHGLWHSVWREGAWGEPVAVVSGPPSPSFDPYDVRAVVVRGNLLFVTWMTDPGRPQRGSWFAFATVEGPSLPTVPYPAARSAATTWVVLMVAGGFIVAAGVFSLVRRSARR